MSSLLLPLVVHQDTLQLLLMRDFPLLTMCICTLLYSPNRRSDMKRPIVIPLQRLSGFVLLVILALASFLQNGSAQEKVDESVSISGGTLYYIAFPDTVTNTYDSRYPPQLQYHPEHKLLVYSPVEQEVRIGRANGISQTEMIGDGEVLDVDLEDISIPIVRLPNSPETNVIKLEADYPVIVYAYMQTAFGMAAFTPLPVSSWGKQYYAATWPGEVIQNIYSMDEYNYRTEPGEAPAEILIIAAYDNTRVTIKSTAPLRECRGCTSVQLDAGEAYLVQSIVDTALSAEVQDDLAGTSISSSKPVGVISGNTRLMHNSEQVVGFAKNAFKDLAVEWISPADMHGTEFVFMPTWDDRHQRDGLDPGESRSSEFVRVFATQSGSTEISWIDGSGVEHAAREPVLHAKEFTHEIITKPVPRVYRSSQPAFAVMSPGSVATLASPWGFPRFLAWSTYMVELVPKERWTSFAPVRVPSALPTDMAHYLNVVTDSANREKIFIRQKEDVPSPFQFQEEVLPGGYVWGTLALDPETSYDLYGIDGATLTGSVYGGWRGNEEHRPGRSGKDDDGKSVSSSSDGGGSDVEVLHPSEYEEDVSLYYGYPLPSMQCVPGDGDEYRIEAIEDCGELLVTINALNDNPAGILSLTLLSDSSSNTSIEFVVPTDPRDIITSAEATIRLKPTQTGKNAHGVVIIRDRTCNSGRWRVEYNYEGLDIVEADPEDELDFDMVRLNETSGELPIVFTNPLGRAIEVQKVGLRWQTQNFRIVRTVPEFDWQSGQAKLVLNSGEKLTVWVDITPHEFRRYRDSLIVYMSCSQSVSVSLNAVTADTVSTGVAGGVVYPGYEMSSLAPNPTNGKSVLQFSLGRNGYTTVRVFDNDGRIVAALAGRRMNEGTHRIEWDARIYPAGTYYIRVESGGWSGLLRLVNTD